MSHYVKMKTKEALDQYTNSSVIPSLHFLYESHWGLQTSNESPFREKFPRLHFRRYLFTGSSCALSENIAVVHHADLKR